MKLNRVSCTQFAGLEELDVRFADGINVIFGKNESGKSTLVNLLSRTLFQNARIDGRSDREFRELYFPSSRKGSSLKADYIDGKLTFETAKGTYTLSKEWGIDGRVTLNTPDGSIRNAKDIEAILREELVYGEGVYTQLLLSSQRGADTALQTLLDASKKTDDKQDIVDAVTMAAAECDGISVDVIEQAIEAKIDELLGKHWDLESGKPVRKNGRWSASLGELHKAYYVLEDAQNVLREIDDLEHASVRATKDCVAHDEAVKNAQTAFDEFQKVAAMLAVRGERLDKIRRLEADLSRMREVLAKWPELEQSLETARFLETELSVARARERYQAAKVLADEIAQLEAALADAVCPTAEQIAEVKAAYRRLQTLQNKLCGMNLTAALQMLGGHDVEVRSLRTGECLAASPEMAITEAVSITVPGVMELTLAPADVDTQEVGALLAAEQETITACFASFAVNSVEALESLADQTAAQRRKLEALGAKLTVSLGSFTLEELATAAQSDLITREVTVIQNAVHALCGGDLTRFITVTETMLEGYKTEYTSVAQLKADAFDVATELEKAKASVEEASAVPACYQNIADPDAHLQMLQATLRQAQQLRENALTAKTIAAERLQTFKEQRPDDPNEAFATAKRRFDECQELLDHWMHIREVFAAQKAELGDNPMVDLARRFADNLAKLSDNRVETEFPDSDRLQMELYSNKRKLDFAKLSEGTKETVSLSFRLAMLDHLFPEGGGVIVLDDPFANMDADRTKRSCALLADCAERHQVLYLTCKEDYAALLGGHEICL